MSSTSQKKEMSICMQVSLSQLLKKIIFQQNGYLQI